MRIKEIILFPHVHVISQKSTSSSCVFHLPLEMLTFRMHYKLNWYFFKTVDCYICVSCGGTIPSSNRSYADCFQETYEQSLHLILNFLFKPEKEM